MTGTVQCYLLVAFVFYLWRQMWHGVSVWEFQTQCRDTPSIRLCHAECAKCILNLQGVWMQAGKAQSLYGLDCPEIETRCGEIFRTHPYRPCGSSGLLYKGQRISCPWVKCPGCGVDRPPPSNAEVKESVVLYVNPPSGSSWQGYRVNFSFYR